MPRGYRSLLLATWLLILPVAAAGAKDKHPVAPTAPLATVTQSPRTLYSARALRRARLLLELERLELRKGQLACARNAIERRLNGAEIWACFRMTR